MSGQSHPSYIELGVPDVGRARAFYGAVLGWPEPDGDGLQQVSTGSLDIGIHGDDDERHFEVFFAVPEIEVALAAVQDAGGSVRRPVHEAAGFGRYAECVDDQGVPFGLRQLE